jgi:hypothetical protein
MQLWRNYRARELANPLLEHLKSKGKKQAHEKTGNSLNTSTQL